MSPVSRGVPPLTTQGAALRRNGHGATVAADTVRASVANRVEQVRGALHGASIYGFGQRVADAMGFRKERVSREQNGSDRLTVELVLAEAELHEREGRPDSAARILSTFQRRLAPVVRLRDGQWLLDLEPLPEGQQ